MDIDKHTFRYLILWFVAGGEIPRVVDGRVLFSAEEAAAVLLDAVDSHDPDQPRTAQLWQVDPVGEIFAITPSVLDRWLGDTHLPPTIYAPGAWAAFSRLCDWLGGDSQ